MARPGLQNAHVYLDLYGGAVTTNPMLHPDRSERRAAHPLVGVGQPVTARLGEKYGRTIGRWEEERRHLAGDGEVMAGRGVSCGGEAENLRASGGGAADQELRIEAVVRRPRQSWRRAEELEEGRERQRTGGGGD
jgi:hypothetical protein